MYAYTKASKVLSKQPQKNSGPSLNKFGTKMDGGCFHLKTFHGNLSCYLASWTIRNFSSFSSGRSEGFRDKDCFEYEINIHVEQEKFEMRVYARYHLPKHSEPHYKCNVTISTALGTVLIPEPLAIGEEFTPLDTGNPEEKRTRPRIDRANVRGEDFQNLKKQLENDTCVLTFRIQHYGIHNITSASCNLLVSNVEYAKSLQANLKQVSSAFLKEKVTLVVGQETEIVNKAVLCARSPVFAKMFESDMQEVKENTVAITDIKMPVLRALVSFLYSGILEECDVQCLWELYYTADKYQIQELQLACTGSILSKISLNNITRALKLSILHNDELLKSAVMSLISLNFKTVALTSEWKNLMHEDPQTGLMASAFFDS